MFDRHSVIWRYAGDLRMLPFLGRAFLLQAAHPTIAAGVAEHSNFVADPFGRFRQSYGLVLDTLYAADGAGVGAEVRSAHRGIRGIGGDGRHYSAFEPEAYFWVVASGFETFVAIADRFLRPMTWGEQRRAYDEARELGRRFGLRDRDMPERYEQFLEWYDWMLAERIVYNRTVQDVLDTIRRPRPPHGVPAAVWPLPRAATGHLAWLTTVGTLSPEVREELRIGWTPREQRELEALGAALRTSEVVPARWLRLPPARAAYRRSRDDEWPATIEPERVAA